MKTRMYTVKAVITFDDGILKGSIKIRAENPEKAAQLAQEKLDEIWRNCALDFNVTSVK